MIKLPRPGPSWRRLQWWLNRDAGAIILRYHRIAEASPDPWPVCVSPAHFDQQLDVLSRQVNVVPLADLTQALTEDRPLRRSVVITFDDGYADNLHAAKPLLERHATPATVFVTTGQIGSDREFWWDELERLLITPFELPDVLELTIGRQQHRWQLDRTGSAEGQDRQHRLQVYYEVHRRLQPQPAPEISRVLDDLRHWARREPDVSPSRRALTADEALALCDGGLIEIGAHTVTHPLLPAFDAGVQADEIRQSKSACEALLGRPVEAFAYPYGRYTPQTAALVRDAGFACACTSDADIVHGRSRPHALPRVYVGDWDGAEFEKRLTRARLAL
jgi:peptidoglycan/xylan/chitin deacetylase (PgdA/CDA1 family)